MCQPILTRVTRYCKCLHSCTQFVSFVFCYRPILLTSFTETESFHNGYFVVSCGTKGCRYDNLRCNDSFASQCSRKHHSLALGQSSNDWHTVKETTVKNIGKWLMCIHQELKYYQHRQAIQRHIPYAKREVEDRNFIHLISEWLQNPP